jgi:hypothetical protein
MISIMYEYITPQNNFFYNFARADSKKANKLEFSLEYNIVYYANKAGTAETYNI